MRNRKSPNFLKIRNLLRKIRVKYRRGHAKGEGFSDILRKLIKSLAQKVCHKRDISERESKGGSWRFCLRCGPWVTVWLVRCQSHTKNEYNIFYYHKSDAEYFFYSTIFSKNKKRALAVLGTFDQFLQKGGVWPQKLT